MSQAIPGKVSVVWDGWTNGKCTPFTSFSISFIQTSADDTQWELKKYLVEFNHTVGRHTGKMIGEDLLATIRKFGLEEKVLVSFPCDFQQLKCIPSGGMDGGQQCQQ